MKNIQYRDWEFEVDTPLTRATYDSISASGSDTCGCNDCQNYIANRANVFPSEIQNLFEELGIDFRKEVEITVIEKLANGLHHISGWFHFKGKILHGKTCRIHLSTDSYTTELTPITDIFSIGFCEGNDLTFFPTTEGLVQVEFTTYIPWVIDKALENK